LPKYQIFVDFLSNSNKNSIQISFSEIEKILLSKLPQSAFKYRAWWANNDSHTFMKYVLKSGWSRDRIDQERKIVEFVHTSYKTNPNMSRVKNKKRSSPKRILHITKDVQIVKKRSHLE